MLPGPATLPIKYKYPITIRLAILSSVLLLIFTFLIYPRYLGLFELDIRPVYPEIAQEAGIEGTVVVQVFIDKKGRVQDTVILKGIPNTGLDEAAISAIRKTRFRPAKQRERPVGVWISIPVNFRLK